MAGRCTLSNVELYKASGKVLTRFRRWQRGRPLTLLITKLTERRGAAGYSGHVAVREGVASDPSNCGHGMKINEHPERPPLLKGRTPSASS